MPWNGSHAVLVEEFIFGFWRSPFNRNGVVVIFDDVDDLVGVVVVVPRGDNVFRTHEVDGVEIIVRGNGGSVGPFGLRMQSVINRFPVFMESPMGR